jgi:uncharacterized protein with FMN-binding domain
MAIFAAITTLTSKAHLKAVENALEQAQAK